MESGAHPVPSHMDPSVPDFGADGASSSNRGGGGVENGHSAGASLQLNASTPPADRTLVFMQRQKFVKQQSMLMEEEIVARMGIIRTHHAHFTAIASKLVSMLEDAAHESMGARGALLLLAGGDNKNSSGRDGAASSDNDLTPQRQLPRGTAASWSPNRVIVSPKSATRLGVASHIDLDGEQQLHRKRVAERRMAQQLREYSGTVSHFSNREFRRTEAHIRREQRLAAIKAAHQRQQQERSAAPVPEKSRRDANLELRQRLQRQIVEEKHAALEERRQRVQRERQAVASAVRRLDDLTTKAAREAASAFLDAEAQAHSAAADVHEEQVARQRAAEKALARGVGQERRSAAHFEREYETQMNKMRASIKRGEHAERVAQAKRLGSGAQGVEVTWPAELTAAQPRATTQPIDEMRYARLCGAREAIVRGFGDRLSGGGSGGGGGGVGRGATPAKLAQSPPPPLRAKDIEALRHLAPQHWRYVESAEPSPMWDAMRAVEAAVVRGPQQVHWRR